MMGPLVNIGGADAGAAERSGVDVEIASLPSNWDLGLPTVPECDRQFEAVQDHGRRLTVVVFDRPSRAMVAEDSL